jgi:hypothetical protein
MYKKIILLVLTFVSVSFSQQVFNSAGYEFEITFPDKWDVKEGTTTMVAVIAKYGDFSSINIVVKENESIGKVTVEDVNIEKFKDDLVSKYKDAFTNFVTVDYGKTIVNGNNAIYFTYNCDVAGKVLRAKQYFMFNGTRMYVISTGCLETETADYEAAFNNCLNSFKFTN